MISHSSRPSPRRLAAIVLGAAMVLLRGGSLTAQDVDPLSKLDPSSKFTVQLLIDSAETAKLPASALMSKALEGIYKKIDSRKIVEVVRKELALLREARQALGPVSDEELKAGADVLWAGGKPQQLAAFRIRQKGRNDLEAFVVWADLITRGVSSEDASSAITKLWQDGADDATFHSLWSAIQTDISSGLNPGAALQNRIRETPGRVPPKITPPEGPQENTSSR
ncbi:MAG: hypothetical protein ABI442_07845 [Gemmatimonadaceae bacterium]